MTFVTKALLGKEDSISSPVFSVSITLPVGEPLEDKMNNPALKGEVSGKEKMRSQINPRLRRSNVVFNSFSSCITNAPEKLSRAPEVSFPEVIPQPQMLAEKFKGGIAFKQLKCFADAHSCWHLDEKMHMIDSDMQFINSESMSLCNFAYEHFNINPDLIKFHRVSGILGFPDKMESILSERMFSGFQFHFFAPAKLTGDTAHANFAKFSSRGATAPLPINNSEELNFWTAIPHSASKAEVSLPMPGVM